MKHTPEFISGYKLAVDQILEAVAEGMAKSMSPLKVIDLIVSKVEDFSLNQLEEYSEDVAAANNTDKESN